jgi:hypothetical protein
MPLGYPGSMQTHAAAPEVFSSTFPTGEPLYCVWVGAHGIAFAERHLRAVIEHKGGRLKALTRCLPPTPHTIRLWVGQRRLDDVLSGLEGAGFEIHAVVSGTQASRRQVTDPDKN